MHGDGSWGVEGAISQCNSPERSVGAVVIVLHADVGVDVELGVVRAGVGGISVVVATVVEHAAGVGLVCGGSVAHRLPVDLDADKASVEGAD